MGGKTIPYDKGQSGTDNPDPVLVTSPPAKIKNTVVAQVIFERRRKNVLLVLFSIFLLVPEVITGRTLAVGRFLIGQPFVKIRR